ncbi:DUF732 domain-containing protein [Rhodococcus daqingensis]|uniref:DUF732 domain-containing protein n=1 Tax=Rhodococcus daqingensis TaxID=2479363 RepID=A0ABW2S563_9NOCA
MRIVRTAGIAALIVGCSLVAACGGPRDEAVGAERSPVASATAPTATASAEPSALAPVPAIEQAAAPAVVPPIAAPDPGVPVPPPTTEPPPTPELRAASIDSRTPDQVVAQSGEKGQRYLGALRAAGLPPSGMDAAEILYAQGACEALADGMPRPEVLREFAGVGQAYSRFIPMSSDQVAETYVSTAERVYC